MRIIIVIALILSAFYASAQKPELQKSSKGPGGRIEIIKKIPGTGLIAVADRDGNIGIYNSDDLSLVKKFKAHNRPVNVLSFNSDGSKLISASINAKLKIWDTQTWKELASFDQPVTGRITFAVFSPDEQNIYFDFNESLYKVRSDFGKIKKVWTDEGYSYLTCGMISPDKKFLVFGSAKSIKIYDLSKEYVVKELGSCSSYINEIEFYGTSGLYSWCQDGTLNYWDLKKQGLMNIRPIHSRIAGMDDAWTRLYLSDDQKWMISGNGSSRINLYSPASGDVIASIQGHKDTVRAFAFSGEKDVFISGGFDGMLNKWKITEKEKEKEQETIKSEIKDNKLETTIAPKVINERKVESQKQFEIPSLVLDIEVWDDNIDGDVISLNWNGKWILKNYEIKKERREIRLILDPEKENSLILYAENLGSAPPNTARVTFKNGNKMEVISINSDLKSCGSVTFKYKK